MIHALHKFHGNPSKSCGDIPLKTKNVTLMLSLDESQEITKVSGVHLLGTMNVPEKIPWKPIQDIQTNIATNKLQAKQNDLVPLSSSMSASICV